MASTLSVGLLLGHATSVFADGTGLIGWGKTMYNPTCAFACRTVIRNSALACTPTEGGDMHGMGHSTTTTPPECFLSDPAFLRTMALCIDVHCSHSDMPPLSQIEDYWAGHLATGTVGDWDLVPVMSYADALALAREDERRAGGNMTTPTHGNGTEPADSSGQDEHSGHSRRRRIKARHGTEEHGEEPAEEQSEGHGEDHGSDASQSPLPVMVPGEPLNQTSMVDMEPWQVQYNGLSDFETNEGIHSTATITITLVALFLPVVLSLLRFIPVLRESHAWTWINSVLNHPPAWGSSHRAPTAAVVGGALIPTRGQALYIALISILNVVLLLGPSVNTHPQSTFLSLREQEVSVIGNRAGSMAMGHVAALFVFSSHNNVLLYLTNWSHGTFLLLHRWLGYWAIFHTCLHSAMLLGYYVEFGDYEAELVSEYWIWGIVGTIAAVAILPFSLLAVRQKFYQAFLAGHQLLVLIFLIGYYYHIWYLYNYNWGYEIWMFAAAGIWASDYVFRIMRMVFNGSRIATVSAVDGSNGEYMRITVDRSSVHGVVYICFPTLSWRFWETHPFSVASSFAYEADQDLAKLETPAKPDMPKTTSVDVIEKADQETSGTSSPKETSQAPMQVFARARPQTTFLTRTRGGVTRLLANRLASSNGSIRIPILLEGSYHSATFSELSHCTTLVCIVGGVGITTVLPVLQENGVRPARLYWGMRDESLLSEVRDLTDRLPRSVRMETSVGARLDVDAILQRELLGRESEGPVGIVVSGPPQMADHVRVAATTLGQTGTSRPFVLVDEGFSW